ncbi:uncharacterized protein V1510DRAFT_404852 [Dipodascopsis tothii]|uniref:uncharacterized protein n=1 Tax=Dipodascopsis tothii TaxID=44089 RepID=UPI0034CD41B5
MDDTLTTAIVISLVFAITIVRGTYLVYNRRLSLTSPYLRRHGSQTNLGALQMARMHALHPMSQRHGVDTTHVYRADADAGDPTLPRYEEDAGLPKYEEVLRQGHLDAPLAPAVPIPVADQTVAVPAAAVAAPAIAVGAVAAAPAATLAGAGADTVITVPPEVHAHQAR